MFPVVAAIGPFTISSLGLSLALAFFFGSFSVWRRAREEHLDDTDIFDAIFIAFFVGVLSSRLFYIVTYLGIFSLDTQHWIKIIFSNQLSWPGFLVGAIYGLALVSKRKKWTFFHFADYAVFGVIIAQILVRIGQFLDGSYLGNSSQLPWALFFPGSSSRVHPVQIYEIIGLFCIYIVLHWLDRHYRLFKWYQDNRGEAKPGLLWLSYLILVTTMLFGLDFLTSRIIAIGWLSLNQLLLLGIFLCSVILVWLRSGQSKFKKDFHSRPAKKDTSTTSELKPIRPPVEPLQKRDRPRRFSRAKIGRDFR